MGEHSIITPETRVIDRESGSRVVCQLARGFTAGGQARSAGGVRRPSSSDSSSSSGSFDHAAGSTRDASRLVAALGETERRGERGGGSPTREKKDVKRRPKRRRHPSRCCGAVAGVSATASLVRRLAVLLLSLLGLTRGASHSVSTPSRGSLLVSSSALVSLLVVGLLRPTVAVPASTAAAASAAPIGRGAARSDAATLARIMPEQRREREEDNENFVKSVVEATMKRRRLPGDGYDYDGDEERAGTPETPETPATLPQRPRESGLESRSRLREAELDTIRRSIVEGLGLERIPDPSKANVSQTEYRRAHQEYLTRLQSRAGKDERARRLYTFHAAERRAASLVNRTRRSALSEPGDEEDDVRTSQRPGALYFPLEIPEDDALVDHATLRLLVDAPDTPDDPESHHVSLYRVTPESRHLVSRQKLPGARGGPRWMELDATELASLWHEYGVENLGVELRFEGRTSSAQPRISRPALNVFTSRLTTEEAARGARRKRRASPEHLMSLHKGRRTECRGENKKCCRHQMTVIFKDLEGFEFIVQPKSFDAGYCKGRCPPRYNPAHHHALLQSLIWKEDKRKAPRPCCAPSKLDELEILYFDENDTTKLKVSSWKNMKVLECACS